jgi:N-acetylmuramoyl-L-alanine amidase/putative methionine-R-sulfoxide reductase with GAF domain
MSATPNNAAPGWENARPLPTSQALDPREADGRNALQGLLAFACIHQQAARRKRDAASTPSDPALRLSREEELALDEILQLVAARALAITGADGVAIALAKDRAIVCRACAGKIAPDAGVRLDPSAGFSGACLSSGEIVRCDDSETDPRVNAHACRTLGARSMIAVPLSAKRRVIGLLEAFSAEPNGFNDSDVRSLNLLGELILAAIRPEEEHHLAEMAREILPNPLVRTVDPIAVRLPGPEAPALQRVDVPSSADVPVVLPPAIKISPAIVTLGVPQAATSKVLVDEKFAPAITAAAPAPAVPEEKTAVKQENAARVAIPEPIVIPVAAASTAGWTVDEVPAFPKDAQTHAKDESYSPAEPSPVVRMTVTAAAAVVAIALLAGLVWKWQRVDQAISANTRAASEVKSAGTQILPAEPGALAPPLKLGGTAEVTGIHHSSTTESSTIVVEVQDQVEYEEHSLDNPPRIYFDLHDTKLSAAIANQTINVDDGFIKRVRVAQPVGGITRVVLEIRDARPEVSVSLDNNPYRLTIQIHKPGTAPASTPQLSVKPQPPNVVKPSPIITTSPKKPAAVSEAQPAAEHFSIVLDAGHGGWDLGAIGKKGLLEKDLTFDVVQRLGSLLETKLGANIVYTRQDDSYLTLEKRAEIANLSHADLFLSVHANYSDLSTARGVETYYTNTYSSVRARTPEAPALQSVNWSGVVDIRAKVTGARKFASDIQQALYGGLAARNPGITNRGVKEAQYVVLTGTQMPAVLAEISFVSSPADEDRLQNAEYRQMIAEALYKGVVKYDQELHRTKMAGVRKPAHEQETR